MLAALLQASKLKECYLQRYCKHQNLRNVTCSVTASTKTKRMLLAALLQTPKLKECYLQRYCKRQNQKNVTCIAYTSAKT